MQEKLLGKLKFVHGKLSCIKNLNRFSEKTNPSLKLLTAKLKNLLQGSELNQYRKENDRQEVQGLWISGGGFDTAIKDVSFTRVVQTNSVLVKGICKSCGIANNFVTPEGAPWPAECPEGDRLSICTDFWIRPLRKTRENGLMLGRKSAKHVENHLTTAKGIENLELFNPVLVATDGLRVSTITKSLKKSFFSYVWEEAGLLQAMDLS